MEEIQSQIDEINARFDENDILVSELSDNIDAQVADIQSSIDEHSSSIDDLNENSGQLRFPLDQDTIDLITEQSPTIMTYLRNNGWIGSLTLAGGTQTIANSLITATSIIFLTRQTVGGAPGFLSWSVTPGNLTVTSSSGTDTSLINYFIIN